GERSASGGQHGLDAAGSERDERGVDNARSWQYAHRGRRHEGRSAAWSLSSGRMMDFLDHALEPLHEDGQLILYRAVHASPADAVARSVLVVGPPGEYVSPATLTRLEPEPPLAL